MTRPEPHGSRLCQKINDLQMHAIYYPTITFLSHAESDFLKQQFSKLNQYQWLIFLSSQAVIQSASLLHTYFNNFHGKIAALGLGTVQALRNANLPIDCYPTTDWTSEGLLKLPSFQDCQTMKIALIKGEGGRELLANELKKRGAMVTEIDCYRRVQPSAEPIDSDTIDIIIVTSVESLQNLKNMTMNLQRALNKTLLVISERIKMIAESFGFKKIILIDNASDEAILTILRTIQ